MSEYLTFQSSLLQSHEATPSTKYQLQIQSLNPFIILSPNQSMLNTVRQNSIWTNCQKQKYFIFLCCFQQQFKEPFSGKVNWHLFKSISKFIRTRNPQQCRSHHLKLIRKFKGIKKFLRLTSKRIRNIEMKINQYRKQLVQIQEEHKLQQFKTAQFNFDLSDSSNQIFGKDILSNLQISGNQKKNENEQQNRTADSYTDNNMCQGHISQVENFSSQGMLYRTCRPSLPSFGQIDDRLIQRNQFPISCKNQAFEGLDKQSLKINDQESKHALKNEFLLNQTFKRI